jgi:hypothetical protein
LSRLQRIERMEAQAVRDALAAGRSVENAGRQQLQGIRRNPKRQFVQAKIERGRHRRDRLRSERVPALPVRPIVGPECHFVPVARADAGGCRQNTQMDQSGLAELTLSDFAGTGQCDYSCREPSAIFIGVGFVSLGARHSRVCLLALRSDVVESHSR